MSGYITNKNNKKKCDSKLITAGNGVQNTPSPRPERPEQATNVLNKMECKEACCSLIRDIIILGYPGADSGCGGKSKRAGKKNSGTNQKPGWRRPFGTGLVRRCPQGLFSPFFIFLRATFSRPFRLSLAPTICPWVSEGGTSFSFHFISFHEPLVYCCDCEFWITCN